MVILQGVNDYLDNNNNSYFQSVSPCKSCLAQSAATIVLLLPGQCLPRQQQQQQQQQQFQIS
jgi:hypothetical protein